ncbi:SWI/SNF and RSC complexes subunit ssr4 [Schizosaccharomyces pombe]
MAATMAAQSLLSIPVEYRSQVWCRANLPYPPAPQLPIPAVVDILTKASQALPQISFSWTLIDQPPDDSLFLVWQAPTLPSPPDGMHFMSNERFFNMDVAGKVLEIHEAKHGFYPLSETRTMHVRCRYRLLGVGFDNFWLVHYFQGSETDSIPANISVAKPPHLRRYPLPDVKTSPFLLQEPKKHIPEGTALSQRETLPNMGSAQMKSQSRTPSFSNVTTSPVPPINSNATAQTAEGHMGATNMTVDNMNKPSIPPNGNTSILMQEDLEIEKGDVMDKLSPQQICTARFIKHAEWMSQVLLTLQSVKDIEPPALWQEPNSMEELGKELKDNKEQLVKQDQKYQSLQGDLSYTDSMSNLLKEFSNIKSAEECDVLQKKIEEFAEAKIVPLSHVTERS